MPRIVKVTPGDLPTVVREGGIVSIIGTDDEGNRVTFAGDHGPMHILLENLTYGDEEEVQVLVDGWQVLEISPVLVQPAPLTTDEALELMMHLDNGTSMFGALSVDARARIWAVVDQPNQETWEHAYAVIVRAEFLMTLLQALRDYSDFDVQPKEMAAPWPTIPTRDQILLALKAVLS